LSDLVVSKVETVETRDNYGRFSIEPVEKGFSVTLGNTMRRVLLGYLQGAAVTRVKIEGIYHEFSTIPHVKEDTTEFILNLKSLRLKPVSGQAGKMILDVKGEKRVTAADIRPSADFEIANPDLYLAYLDSEEAKLNVELDIELARGYREAESSGNLPVGVIPVDAVFTPTRKVNFTVEPIHAGQETSHERLWLEVWTDGTIMPTDAISNAAEILIEQLSPIAGLSRVVPVQGEKEPVRSTIAPELASMPVEQLNLSVRTLNCLRRGNINTVGELMSKSEKDLMSLRNFGTKSKLELEERLETLGLSMPS
jgi:DNA-directed RNA polymerase subunit alpha